MKTRLLAESDKRYYLICRAVFILALLLHVAFFITFTVLNITVLAIFNIFSILLFIGTLILNEFGHSKMAITFAIAEVITHQVIATIILGLETSFYLYILFCIMLPLLTSRGYSRWKQISIGFSIIILFALHLYMHGREPLHQLSHGIELGFSLFNQAGAVILLVGIAAIFNTTVIRYEEKLKEKQRYAYSLLLNILPESIAKRLNLKEEPIADGFTEASVLFADLTNFTELASTMMPAQLVEMLDGLYARFDALTDTFGCEKIKTIGDAFMVAAGVPEPCEDHADRILKFGFAILEATEEFNRAENMNLQIRIGCNAGPLIAGVIGRKKFSYDLWGDTVNIASRLESTGIPGKIHTSNTIKTASTVQFRFNSRGHIPLKGKGNVETYIVEQI